MLEHDRPDGPQADHVDPLDLVITTAGLFPDFAGTGVSNGDEHPTGFANLLVNLANAAVSQRTLDNTWSRLGLQDQWTVCGLMLEQCLEEDNDRVLAGEISPDKSLSKRLLLITVNLHRAHVLAAKNDIMTPVRDRVRTGLQAFRREHDYLPDLGLALDLNPRDTAPAGPIIDLADLDDHPVGLHGFVILADPAHRDPLANHIRAAFSYDRDYDKRRPLKLMYPNRRRGGLVGWMGNYCMKHLKSPALAQFTPRRPTRQTGGVWDQAKRFNHAEKGERTLREHRQALADLRKQRERQSAMFWR